MWAAHYTMDGDILAANVGAAMGIDGATWSMDLRLAEDGGYLVGSAVMAKATDATAGTFEMIMHITNIDDASNTVTKPENIESLGGRGPERGPGGLGREFRP